METAMSATEAFISSDPSLLDLTVVHEFLTTSYWAKGISRETVKLSLENSLCFGVYIINAQVGFARLITDRATFAYLADVFILPEYRQHGLAKMLIKEIINHSDLQGIRHWILATRDAHSLYRKFGFQQLCEPSRMMEKSLSCESN
jgi:N-acetylglutamate synthase-like GNAT family acetyltransferase